MDFGRAHPEVGSELEESSASPGPYRNLEQNQYILWFEGHQPYAIREPRITQ